MGAGHDHAAGANVRRLAIALALTATFVFIELLGAWWFNSLALLSDAAHMFTDTAALAIALVAIRVGDRPADDKRTFGYRRFEILAAAFNAILLFLVAAYILYEGIGRLIEAQSVHAAGMLGVATAGLAINLISMRILAPAKDDSMNVRGAFLEVWSDLLGSAGVIVAALVIRLTGWQWVDPLVAIAIGLFVLPRTWVLLRETMNVLLQGVPSGFDLQRVREAIGAVPGVDGVHDLHLWSLSGSDGTLTAHVELTPAAEPEEVRRTIARMLDARFHLHHVTLQMEATSCGDQAALHR